MSSQEDREFNSGCSGFVVGVVLMIIVFAVTGSCAKRAAPTITHPTTYSMLVSNEEVIVPNGYKLVSVSDEQFYCQEQNSDQNRVAECSPTDGTIGDRYILPEGYVILGIQTDSDKDVEKVFYCMNLRTEVVTYCTVIVPMND